MLLNSQAKPTCLLSARNSTSCGFLKLRIYIIPISVQNLKKRWGKLYAPKSYLKLRPHIVQWFRLSVSYFAVAWLLKAWTSKLDIWTTFFPSKASWICWGMTGSGRLSWRGFKASCSSHYRQQYSIFLQNFIFWKGFEKDKIVDVCQTKVNRYCYLKPFFSL